VSFPTCEHPGCDKPVLIPVRVNVEAPTCWMRLLNEESPPLQGWQGGFLFEEGRVVKTYCADHAREAKAVQQVQTENIPWPRRAIAEIQAIEDQRFFEVLDKIEAEDQNSAKQKALYEKRTRRAWPVG
jgi:hypothetical protein